MKYFLYVSSEYYFYSVKLNNTIYLILRKIILHPIFVTETYYMVVYYLFFILINN